jgi:hypothetical protein
MRSMPLVGKLAVLAFILFVTVLSLVVASMKTRLASRQPCKRWFAFVSGTIASMFVFGGWVGAYGLGAAEPGIGGVAFGAFAGLIWGAVFSGINSTILWHAFSTPNAELESKTSLFETDINLLFSRIKDSVLGFKLRPEFAPTGLLPWGLFFAAVLLPALWSFGFCLLTFITEGAPGVDPIVPLD